MVVGNLELRRALQGRRMGGVVRAVESAKILRAECARGLRDGVLFPDSCLQILIEKAMGSKGKE